MISDFHLHILQIINAENIFISNVFVILLKIKYGAHIFKSSISRNFDRLFNFNLMQHSAVGGLLIPVPQIFIEREGNSFPSDHKTHGVNTPRPLPSSASFPHRRQNTSLLDESNIYCLFCLLEIFLIIFIIFLIIFVFVFRNQH